MLGGMKKKPVGVVIASYGIAKTRKKKKDAKKGVK